jgi:hypothetical protein
VSVARLLYVGGHLPYCVGAAPYGFDANGPKAVASEGSGTIFPLSMSQDEYALFLWRIKTWELVGDLEIDYSNQGETWQASTSIEILYERTATENQLLCLANNSNGSPFALGEQAVSFLGTYTVEIEEEPVESPAEFTLSLDFNVGTLVGQNELSFTAVGISQNNTNALAASIGVFCEIVTEGYSARIVSAETTLGDPGGSQISGGGIANLEILLPTEGTAPEGRTVPLFLSPSSSGGGVTLNNLRLRPVEFYEYALSGNPPLYDSETGQVIVGL